MEKWIGIKLRDLENVELLKSFVSKMGYGALQLDEELLMTSKLDLCIFDAFTFQESSALLKKMKLKFHPLILPVLVLSHSATSTASLKKQMVIDDVVETPLAASILKEKIGHLLALRDFSKKNFIEMNEAQREIISLHEEKALKNNFINILMHDLRSPITAAKLSSALMLRDKDITSKQQNTLHRIVKSLDRSDLMIQDLLNANMIQAGKTLPVVPESCELSGEIKSFVKDLSTIYGERFCFKCEEKLKGIWDVSLIRRALENLCNNAIKYGRDNAPIDIALHFEGENATLSVRNQGKTLSNEEQLKMFQIFHRNENAQKGHKTGWGIGLTLVKGVALAHGGSVSISSTHKEGTLFTLILPQLACG